MNSSQYILIVEDTEDYSAILAMYLDKEGFSYKIAENGVKALQIAQKAAPALILMDIMLPGMNGFKLAQLFKTNIAFKDIPIVVISVLNTAADKELAKKIGVNEYLVKSFSDSELKAVLKKYL